MQNIFRKTTQYSKHFSNTRVPQTLIVNQNRQVSSYAEALSVNIKKHLRKTDNLRRALAGIGSARDKVYKKWVPPPHLSREEVQKRSSEANPKGITREHQFRGNMLELQREIFEAAKTRDMQRALYAYHKMERNVYPNVVLYTALIKACGTNLGEAIQIYNDMKRKNIRPNTTTFSTLLDSCIANAHLPRAMFFFKEFTKLTNVMNRKKATMRFYFKLLRFCYDMDAPHQAFVIYKVMIDRKAITVDRNRILEIPLDFLKQFIPDEKQAKEFGLKMARSFKPSYKQYESGEFHEEFRPVDPIPDLPMTERLFNTPLRMTHEQASEIYENMGMDPMRDYDPQYDFPIQRFKNRDWDAAIKEAFVRVYEDIDDWDNVPEFQVVTIKNPKDERELLTKIVQEYYLEKLYTADGVEEMSNVVQEMRQNFKKLRDITNSRKRFHWIPVVIDEKTFLSHIPTCISMDLCNHETIQRAKQEFLEKIKDDEVRTEIESEMDKRLKIYWIDEDGKIIPDFVM